MADLEGELKPVLSSLIVGDNLTLSSWVRRRLATWAAKTSMTAEFIEPKGAAIKFAEREYLRLHREPPKNFNVWIGYYAGRPTQAALYHHSFNFSFADEPHKGPVAPNTQATIIGLGKMLVQITSSSLPGLRVGIKDENISKLVRIWPEKIADDLSWPPTRILDEQDIRIILLGLSRAFANT